MVLTGTQVHSVYLLTGFVMRKQTVQTAVMRYAAVGVYLFIYLLGRQKSNISSVSAPSTDFLRR
mgnify:CR=1 FL=1